MFDPSDPLVCHSLQLRPSLWAVVFNTLQQLGAEWSWRQDDPASATVKEVIDEINKATDQAVFWGCMMVGDIKWIVRAPQAFELVCDGSVYDRVDYPALYAVIDPAYILDADTFKVPDLMDRFPLGSDTTGLEGGNDEITLTVAQLPSHAHTYDKITATFIDPGVAPSVIGIDDINSEGTGLTGDGDPVSIINPYHTVRPVIMASYPEGV